MTISGSLSAALSGLTAVSRAAEIVSSNISNALTDGYGKRELQLSSRVLAGSGVGVSIDGVSRSGNSVLINNRRQSEANLGQSATQFSFLSNIEAAIGMPNDPASLTGRMTTLQSSMIQAASRPDNEARLQSVVESANSVTRHLNTISDKVQEGRMQADRAIATSVEQLNSTLQKIATVNGRIVQYSGGSNDPSALLDQRQALIDQIADLIPLREVPRDNGTIALFTPGGAILLDGNPAKIGFDPVGIITADMSLAGGTLSGLTINGNPVSTSAESGPIAGGRLAGLFAVRDDQAPDFQARLDAVARDLIERFQDPAVDPTLSATDPGLFTDGGVAFTATNEVGLAGRVTVNASVDPTAGGAYWRLRDGIGAASIGDPGDATLLNALSDALGFARLPATGGFIAQHSATGLSGDLLSGVSVQLTTQETEQTYLRAQTESLIGMELRDGVDTDDEMQKLLLIEQAFSANARVITTIDDMIQTLLRL